MSPLHPYYEGSNILDSVDDGDDDGAAANPRLPPLRGSRGDYPFDRDEYLEVIVAPLHDVVFGDESGTDEVALHCAVAAWIGSPRQWRMFDEQWRRVLERHGAPPFHATEFFARPAHQSRKSPYRGWTHDQLMELLTDLLSAIDNRLIRPVGSAVNLAHWLAAPAAQRVFSSGAPMTLSYWEHAGAARKLSTDQYSDQVAYYPAFSGMALAALKESRPSAKLSVVMDNNDLYGPTAARMVTETQARSEGGEMSRVESVIFADDEQHPGLQAADLYAHVMRVVIDGQKELNSFYELARDRLSRKRPGLQIVDADALEASAQQIDRQLGLITGALEQKVRERRQQADDCA